MDMECPFNAYQLSIETWLLHYVHVANYDHVSDPILDGITWFVSGNFRR